MIQISSSHLGHSYLSKEGVIIRNARAMRGQQRCSLGTSLEARSVLGVARLAVGSNSCAMPKNGSFA